MSLHSGAKYAAAERPHSLTKLLLTTKADEQQAKVGNAPEL